MSRWYYAKDKQKHGPVTIDELKALLRAGQLQPTDMLLEEGAQKWVAASSVTELFVNSVPVAQLATPSTTKPANKIPPKAVVVGGVVAGAFLLLCCGTCGFMAFLGDQMGRAIRADFAQGDALWDKGDKKAGAAKYRHIIDDAKDHLILKEDRPRLYGRVIDFEYESGRADVGKAFIDKAENKGVVPTLNNPDAKAVVAAIQAEKVRIEGEKKLVAEAKKKKEGG